MGQHRWGVTKLKLEQFVGTSHVSAPGKARRAVPTETSNGEVIMKNRQMKEP